jgi:predicted DNA-binding transcriptional regulator YafY
VLTAAAQACRDAERLAFVHTAADGTCTERHVEPCKLVPLGRRWYLVAYDLVRHDWRSFRLDRVATPRGTGVRFRPRELPAEDAAAFVRAGLRQLPSSHDVEVRVEAPADEVRSRVGRWATVEEDGADGTACRLRMRTDSLDWAALAVGSVGAEFTVVAPPELRDLVRRWGDRFARAGRRSGPEASPVVS